MTDSIIWLEENIKSLPTDITSDLRKEFESHINDLLLNNFESLVQILYRIDVDENKLKDRLKHYSQIDAATVITDLILERLSQKEKSRRQFRQRDNDINIDESEKW